MAATGGMREMEKKREKRKRKIGKIKIREKIGDRQRKMRELVMAGKKKDEKGIY